MPRVTVKVYTTLKEKIGASRVDVDAADAAGAIAGLRAKHASIVDGVLLDAAGVVRNHFTLTLNSQILDPHKLAGVPVKDGDMLHIFPPIAGGVSARRAAAGPRSLRRGLEDRRRVPPR